MWTARDFPGTREQSLNLALRSPGGLRKWTARKKRICQDRFFMWVPVAVPITHLTSLLAKNETGKSSQAETPKSEWGIFCGSMMQHFTLFIDSKLAEGGGGGVSLAGFLCLGEDYFGFSKFLFCRFGKLLCFLFPTKKLTKHWIQSSFALSNPSVHSEVSFSPHAICIKSNRFSWFLSKEKLLSTCSQALLGKSHFFISCCCRSLGKRVGPSCWRPLGRAWL